MRSALVFAAVAACHGSDPQGAAPAPAAKGSCDGWGADQMEVIGKKKLEYAKAGVIAYHAQLVYQHLAPLKIARSEEVVTNTNSSPAVGPTVKTDKGTFVVGPTFATGGKVPPDLDLVVDGKNQVFSVTRDDKLTLEPYFTCECVPKTCPPKPGETHRVLYGPLAPEQTFAGSVTVHYDERHLDPQYADPNLECGC